MSSRSDVVDHYKRKFYQRFIDPDLVVEPISLSVPLKQTDHRPVQQHLQPLNKQGLVFIVTLLAIFPLFPRHLSLREYRLSFLGTACSSLYSLYSLYGIAMQHNTDHRVLAAVEAYVLRLSCGWLHQSVWAKIIRSVTPVLHRHGAFLNTPVAAVQRWWFR